jgi:tRNA A-37 threonylcarbamoyl transferase component Bud32
VADNPAMLNYAPSGYVAVGDVIADKYRVDRILGIGGMGMVVAATHMLLGQVVAIKLMLPTSNASARGRFVREAQAVVRLRSEHICRVLDVGMHRETPFIVMELLAGCDLSQELERRVLPLTELVDYMMQALEGLAEAHAYGVVHRDLKPANLFVTYTNDGSPLIKVLDFGISKTTGGSTRTSEMMGTPAYMAPEQIASAKSVDQRADIWAMGVIAYEALSGQGPFVADTLPGMVMAVIHAEPHPLANVPVGFAKAIARCLAKHPDQRFANVAELADAVAPYGSPASAELARKIGRLARPSARIMEVAPPSATVPTTLQGAAKATTVAPVPAQRLGRIALIAMVSAALGVGGAAKILTKGHTEPVAMAIDPPRVVVAPAPIEPAHVEPEHVEPAHVEPVHVEPAHVEPARVERHHAATAEHVVAQPVVVEAPAPHLVATPPVAASAPHVAPSNALMPLPDEPIPAVLTPTAVDERLVSTRTKIRVCGDTNDQHGRVTVVVQVAPNGDATAAVTTRSPTDLGRCVADVLQQMKFGVTRQGGVFARTYIF